MKNAWKCIVLLLGVWLNGCATLPEDISGVFSLKKEIGCGNDTQTSLFGVRGCACDPECRKYGDCCQDSPFFQPEEQKLGASPFVCSSSAPVYLVGKCPHGWDNPVVRHGCEHPDETFRDPLKDSPVTSLITNQSYVNFYCAACHGDLHPGAVEIWTFRIACDIMPQFMNFSIDQYAKHLAYDTAHSTWYLNITTDNEESSDVTTDDDDTVNTCELVPVMSDTARNEGRLCEQYVVSSCPQSWTDHMVKERCEAYTSYICFEFATFRNEHCAVCNNGSTAVGCLKHTIYSTESRFGPSFSVLIDWRGMKQAQQCSQREIYDPFLGSCREIFNIETSEDNKTETLGTCVRVSLSQEEYELAEDNSSAYVPAHNKTYYKHEFLIHYNLLIICLPEDAENRFAPELGYFTLVGLTLSILFLVLHLTVFFLVPKLRNFSATNLSCLCTSLLLLYISFIVSGSMKPRTAGCITVAVFIHYSLLTSFFWMLTISFDIFRAMKQATSKLVISKGTQRLRFGLYCTSSWLLPAVIVGIGLAMDSWWPESAFVPGYGQGACWLNHSDALLIFCVTPLATMVVSNVCFFCWTAYLIHVNSEAASSASRTRKEFPLFLRLGLIMGITWIIGVVAASVDIPGLWHLFVIFNTLQGLFIFIAFTCTRKVWKEVRNVMYGHKILTRTTTTDTTTQSTTDRRPSQPAMQNRHLLNME